MKKGQKIKVQFLMGADASNGVKPGMVGTVCDSSTDELRYVQFKHAIIPMYARQVKILKRKKA